MFNASYFQKSSREGKITNVLGKVKILKELEKKREETHKTTMRVY